MVGVFFMFIGKKKRNVVNFSTTKAFPQLHSTTKKHQILKKFM